MIAIFSKVLLLINFYHMNHSSRFIIIIDLRIFYYYFNNIPIHCNTNPNPIDDTYCSIKSLASEPIIT